MSGHKLEPNYFTFRFLATESMQHCVPSTVSSGLANLPLDYVYVNGSRTNQRTTKKLPTGEPLDGKKSYEMIMPYFTTLDISPDEVAKIGFDMLNKLYPEVGSANTHEDYGLNSKCSFPNPIRPWRSLDTKRKPLATTQQNRCSCRG